MKQGKPHVPFPVEIDDRSEPETSGSHLNVFRGIKAGIIITLAFFWVPFLAIHYLWGWWSVCVCGPALFLIAVGMGSLARYGGFTGPTVNQRRSPEVF